MVAKFFLTEQANKRGTIVWFVLMLMMVIVSALMQMVDITISMSIVVGLLLLPLLIVLWLHPKHLLLLMVVVVQFHALITMILVGTLHLPTIVPRLFITWKEGLLLAVTLYVCLMVIQTGKLPFKIGFLDILIILFFSLTVIYIFFPGKLTNSIAIKMRGFKVDAFFFMAYFLARSMHWKRRDLKLTIYLIFGLGILAAIVAIMERVLLPNDFLLRIGYGDLMVFQGFDLNDKIFFATPNSLPASFYSWIGSYLVQRAGSLYISPLGYAFVSIIFVSFAYSFFLNATSIRNKLFFGSLGLLFFVGMALSYTRSALIFLFISLFIMTLWLFKPASRLIVIITMTVLITFAGLFILFIPVNSNSPIDFLFNDSSTQSHLKGWQDSFAVMIAEPLGLGLGAAGSVAQKFLNGKGVSNESWYFQIASEMGIFMMLLFMAIIIYWLMLSLRIAQQSNDPIIKSFAWGMFGSGLGLSLNGLVLHVWLEPHIALTYWLLAGMLVTVWKTEKYKCAY